MGTSDQTKKNRNALPTRLYALHPGMEPDQGRGKRKPVWLDTETLRKKYRLEAAAVVEWKDAPGHEHTNVEGRPWEDKREVDGRGWRDFIHLYPMPVHESTERNYWLQLKFARSCHFYTTGHKKPKHPKA